MEEEKNHSNIRRKVRKIRNFFKNLVLFVTMSLIFMTINLIFMPQTLWFIPISIIWIFLLIAHYFHAYDIEIFGSNWEEEKINELLKSNK